MAALLALLAAVGFGSLFTRARALALTATVMLLLPTCYLVVALIAARVNDDTTANIGAGIAVLGMLTAAAAAPAMALGFALRRYLTTRRNARLDGGGRPPDASNH